MAEVGKRTAICFSGTSGGSLTGNRATNKEKVMRLLLAGGAGYVGSALIPRLLERGYLVDVVDLFWFGNNLPPETGLLNKDLFEVTVEDLRDYDQVIFLAGLSNDPMAEYSPSKNFVYNAAAPAYLAYTAKKAGVKRYIYASSCSVYGYTVNELYDETRPVASSYPYGISKLQGEQAVMNLMDEQFSVVALRKGTISGYSPRMRLDLIVNAMFRSAVQDAVITINNPSIWRPILAMEDAISAYIRVIEAHESISGIFNIASGNYTVGEVGDLVKGEIEQQLGSKVNLVIKHLQDFRNYKVSFEKAKNVLSFHPQHDVQAIVRQLVREMGKFSDWNNPVYYNVQMFRTSENGVSNHVLSKPVGVGR
jgi:nucleoside-diphosphate-sugar epimerase